MQSTFKTEAGQYSFRAQLFYSDLTETLRGQPWISKQGSCRLSLQCLGITILHVHPLQIFSNINITFS